MQGLYGAVELITAYPQFYCDMDMVCHPLNSGIRTAQKNVQRSRFNHNTMDPRPLMGVRYDPGDLHKGMTVFQSMERLSGVRKKTIVMDLPQWPMPPELRDLVGDNYILTRPATTRTDWISFSRNPLPEYLVMACNWARDDGFKIVMAADIVPGYEDPVIPMATPDVAFMNGELTTEQLMALTANAKGIIAPVGWVVPVALSYQIPSLIVLGGQLANNDPKVLTDPRLMWNRLTWAMPDRPCPCGDVTHRCDRVISNLRPYYDEFLKTVKETA